MEPLIIDVIELKYYCPLCDEIVPARDIHFDNQTPKHSVLDPVNREGYAVRSTHTVYQVPEEMLEKAPEEMLEKAREGYIEGGDGGKMLKLYEEAKALNEELRELVDSLRDIRGAVADKLTVAMNREIRDEDVMDVAEPRTPRTDIDHMCPRCNAGISRQILRVEDVEYSPDDGDDRLLDVWECSICGAGYAYAVEVV